VYDAPTLVTYEKLSEFFKTLGVPSNLYQTKAEEYYNKAYDAFPRIVKEASFDVTNEDEDEETQISSTDIETIQVGSIDEDGNKVAYENRSTFHNGWVYQ
jgi:hypothetical protein